MKELTFLAIGFALGAIVMKCKRDRKDLQAEVEVLRRKNAN